MVRIGVWWWHGQKYLYTDLVVYWANDPLIYWFTDTDTDLLIYTTSNVINETSSQSYYINDTKVYDFRILDSYVYTIS